MTARPRSLKALTAWFIARTKLGNDQRITNTGGGNTSSKLIESRIRSPANPSTGVLWVKGSGGDLRTSTRDNFSSLYQSKLIGLQKSYAARDHKGLKSQAEDDMVAAYNHATFNLNPRASSIDTPLHQFYPGEVRGSHAPERGHRTIAAIGELREDHPGNFRWRNGICEVDAPRL